MKDMIKIYSKDGLEEELLIKDIMYVKVNGYLWKGKK